MSPLLIAYMIIAVFTMRRSAWKALSKTRTHITINGDRKRIEYHWPLHRAVLHGIRVGSLWPFYWALRAFWHTSDNHNDFWKRVLTSEPSNARRQRQLEASKARTLALEKELGYAD